ncbi:MAG: glycerol-3-phosphate dehydrogenase [Betaproteobacteria bacterium]|nr:glycerol-3-phosphate dehydrogenase [Betaproteobacteria bacterium]
MKIAVLGGGNGCYAAAAELSEKGHEVRFWRRDAAAFGPVLESRTITVKDFRGRREVTLALATADIGAALRDAQLIVVPTPAFAQADIARAMAPHVSDGQVVYLPPGTFGSYVMSRALRDAGSRAEVSIGETGTLPYLVRKHGPAEIQISVYATRLPTGVFPAKRTVEAMKIIREAYPAAETAEDALAGALMNAGPAIHAPLILMNAGPLQHFEKWDIHNEGTQPAIRAVTDRLDAERIAVRVALGYGAPHFPLSDHYTGREEWMYGRKSHQMLTDSGDWREHIDLTTHRYMREDVEYGLALLVSVAQWAGAPCPIAAGLLAMGSAICDGDFRARGPRTLEALGLAKLDRAGMARLLQNGV